MGTRIFQKPDLKKLRTEVPEAIFRDPKELAKLKDVLRPETYLKLVYDRIALKEKELAGIAEHTASAAHEAKVSLERAKAPLEAEVSLLKDVLIRMRQEREYLEKPLIEKEQDLSEREGVLNVKDKSIQVREQNVFEREQATEQKLQSLQDLASVLGTQKVSLDIRDKKVEAKESLVSERELAHLVRIETQASETRARNLSLEERENAVRLRELNIDSKEENLAAREKELKQYDLYIKSRRQALLAAQRYGITKER